MNQTLGQAVGQMSKSSANIYFNFFNYFFFSQMYMYYFLYHINHIFIYIFTFKHFKQAIFSSVFIYFLLFWKEWPGYSLQIHFLCSTEEKKLV